MFDVHYKHSTDLSTCGWPGCWWWRGADLLRLLNLKENFSFSFLSLARWRSWWRLVRGPQLRSVTSPEEGLGTTSILLLRSVLALVQINFTMAAANFLHMFTGD